MAVMILAMLATIPLLLPITGAIAASEPHTTVSIADDDLPPGCVEAYNQAAQLGEQRRYAEALAAHDALRAMLLRRRPLGKTQRQMLMLQSYNRGNIHAAALYNDKAANLHFDTRPAQIDNARKACVEYAKAAAYFPSEAAFFAHLHFSHGLAFQQLEWATSQHRGTAARRRGDTHAPEAIAAFRRALSATTRLGPSPGAEFAHYTVDAGKVRKFLANVLAFDARRCHEAVAVLVEHPAVVAGDRRPVIEEVSFVRNCLEGKMSFNTAPAAGDERTPSLHARVLQAVTVLAGAKRGLGHHFRRDAHRLLTAVFAADGGGEQQQRALMQRLLPLLALSQPPRAPAAAAPADEIETWKQTRLADAVAAASRANADADPAAPGGAAVVAAIATVTAYEEATVAMARSLASIGVPGFVVLVIGDGNSSNTNDATIVAARLRRRGVAFAVAAPHGYGTSWSVSHSDDSEGMHELGPACRGWRRVHHFKSAFAADILGVCSTDLGQGLEEVMEHQ